MCPAYNDIVPPVPEYAWANEAYTFGEVFTKFLDLL